jgi:hypothetical protein
MIQTFFPASLAELKQTKIYWVIDRLLNEVVFPDEVAEKCPEVVVRFVSNITTMAMSDTAAPTVIWNVRQPVLAVSAVWGIIIGFVGGYSLWRIAAEQQQQKRNRSSGGKYHKKNKFESNNVGSQLPKSMTRLWALAFGAFGVMNLSALPLHCLMPAPESSYPKEVRLHTHNKRLLLLMYCFCVSVSNISITRHQHDSASSKYIFFHSHRMQCCGPLTPT